MEDLRHALFLLFDLKGTKMLFLGLLPRYFDLKNQFVYSLLSLSKYGGKDLANAIL